MAGFHFSNTNANKKWPVYTTMIYTYVNHINMPLLHCREVVLPTNAFDSKEKFLTVLRQEFEGGTFVLHEQIY